MRYGFLTETHEEKPVSRLQRASAASFEKQEQYSFPQRTELGLERDD